MSIEQKIAALLEESQKLQAEETIALPEEFAEMTLEELEEFAVSEEFEQLDELSKGTLRSYINKAGGQMLGAAVKAMDGHKYTDSEKVKLQKRADNVDKAVDKFKVKKEEVEQEENDFVYDDIDSIFADDSTISEEFRTKVSTIFEARVLDRVAQIEEQIETHYASMLEEAVESVKEELTDKVNDYLSYVVEQWMEENQIAIDNGIRSELAEDFINGLKNLFAEHYIDVPAEKVDLVDELAAKVEELSGKLDEEVERSIEYRNALFDAHKAEVTREVCEGLTATQVEKIKALAESVDYSTEEEYRAKLDTIRENYFPSGVKKADATALHEQVEDVAEKKVVSDAFMNSIVQSISKTTRI